MRNGKGDDQRNKVRNDRKKMITKYFDMTKVMR